ncbi:hypothetical protein BY996DRAFT_6523658 [Phakopsora pachyrhizi]|nr:hypothetical protein BY996DRAFT_6523658 [Phakopsora pachyrhizi]
MVEMVLQEALTEEEVYEAPEKVLEDTDLSASNPKITCFSGQQLSFFAYETISVLEIHSRDSPKQIMKLNKDPVGRLLLKSCAINLLIDFISDSPYSIHHLSMTKIPDYLMDSVINQVSARDLSAEEQDQNRPRRLEWKRGLYLIKLKLDCLVMCLPRLPQIFQDSWTRVLICFVRVLGFEHQNPNGEDIAHIQRSATRQQSKYQGRVLSQTNGGYYQVVQLLRDFKPSHREIKPSENSQVIREQLDLDLLNLLNKEIQLEQLKKLELMGFMATADIRGHLTRRVRPIGPRIDMDKGKDKEDKGLQKGRSRTVDEDKEKNKRGSIGVKKSPTKARSFIS